MVTREIMYIETIVFIIIISVYLAYKKLLDSFIKNKLKEMDKGSNELK